MKARKPALTIRRLVLLVLENNLDEVVKTLEKAIKNPKRLIQLLELAAKLNGELGSSRRSDGPVSIILQTSMPLDALGPHPPALPRREARDAETR
jgi:hypothetical protein